MATDSRIQHFIYNEITCSDDFRIWLVAFECYCRAIDPDMQANQMHNCLLASLGDHGNRTLMAHAEDWDKMTYADTIAVLKQRYVKTDKKQILVHFANMRLGEDDKSERLSDYVERLRRVAQVLKRATDENILEKLLADPNVAKMDNGKVFEKLMTDDITLDKLLQWQCARESCEKLRNDVASKDTCLNLLRVPYEKSRRNSTSSQNSNRSNNSNHSTSSNTYINNSNKRWCRNCGRKEFPHDRKCPAEGQKCRNIKCNRFGHFERCCPMNKRNVRKVEKFADANAVSSNSDSEKETSNSKKIHILTKFVNTVNKLPCPKATVCCNNNDLVTFVLDTGSQSNIITASSYYKLKQKPTLRPTDVRLIPFNATEALPTLGEFDIQITWMGETKMVNIVVVKSNKHVENLLCFETMSQFKINWNDVFVPHQNVQMVTSHELSNWVDGVDTTKLSSTQLETFILMKYKHLFRNETGEVQDYEAHVDFDNAKPTRCPPQRIPNRLLAPTKQSVERWQSQNICAPVTYQDNITWISSLNPIEKSNNKGAHDILGPENVRLTINLKNVNKHIIRNTNCTLLPDSKQIAFDLANSIVFSKLDVRDAFSTIPLDEESSKHFAFSTPFGLFKLKRLVQGMCNSSDIYHQYMTDHFRDIELTKSCIDDFLIYGKPEPHAMGTQDAELSAIARHDKALFSTLDRIESLNLTLNPEKCKFRQDEVPFYGNMVSKHGLKPFEKKLSAFINTRIPKDKTELHSFVGMAAHFHDRLPDLANNGNQLYNLLKKNQTFNWQDIHTKTFEEVKHSLFTGYLSHFDETRPTRLYVDAGPHGISYVLTQINKNNNNVLTECGSHTFSDAQQRYSQVEKECLALTWAIDHLRLKLLLLPDLIIYTDSKSVVDIVNNESTRQSKSNRIQSWMSNMPGGNFLIKHIPGKQNIADFISRCHNSDKSATFDQKFKTIYMVKQINQISLEELRAETKTDPALHEIANCIITNKIPSTSNKYHTVYDSISLNENDLLIINDKLVIPKSLEEKVLDTIHSGHNGYPICLSVLKKHYFFPEMAKKLKYKISTCRACQAASNKTTVEPMIIMPKDKEAKKITSIDFSSRTPSNNYVLVLTEALSGYPIMKISKNLTSSSAIKILKKIFEEFDFRPKIIRSDNGPAFISNEFKVFCLENGITHQLCTPYWPNANGMPESRMKIINKSIRCSKVDNSNWETILDRAIKIYRAARHPSTGFSPNEVLGLPDDIGMPTVQKPKVVDITQLLKNDLETKMKSKATNDKNKHAKPANIQVGDKVLYRWNANNKHMPRYDPNEYVISAAKGTMLTAKRKDHETTKNMSFFKKIQYLNNIIPQRQIWCYMLGDTLAKRIKHAKLQKELEQIQKQVAEAKTEAEKLKQQNAALQTTIEKATTTTNSDSTTLDKPDTEINISQPNTNNDQQNDNHKLRIISTSSEFNELNTSIKEAKESEQQNTNELIATQSPQKSSETNQSTKVKTDTSDINKTGQGQDEVQDSLDDTIIHRKKYHTTMQQTIEEAAKITASLKPRNQIKKGGDDRITNKTND
jgi:hypothetical protein